jgi:hypothetical protein
VIDKAVAATCTTDGKTEGKHCSRCEEVLVAQTTVPALGHSHAAVVTAPTCAKPGYTTHTCSCGDTYTDSEVPATGNHVYANGVCTGCQMPQLKFYGANVMLQTNLAIGYGVRKTQVDAYDSVYLKCVMNGVETIVEEYVVSGGVYYFYFRGIAPRSVGDEVVAQFYGIKNGVEYSSTERSYSILEYCQNSLNKISSKTPLGTLLVDLLNYGTAMQTYTKYKTKEPVNGILTDTQKSWGTATDRTLETALDAKYEVIDNPQVSWRGAGLTLNETVAIRYLIAPKAGVDVSRLTLKVKMATGAETIITSDLFTDKGNGTYEIYFDQMNASQMSEMVYATVCMDGVPVSNTARYSVESYAYTNQNSTDTNLAKLVKAMIRYGDSAVAFVEANQ